MRNPNNKVEDAKKNSQTNEHTVYMRTDIGKALI